MAMKLNFKKPILFILLFGIYYSVDVYAFGNDTSPFLWAVVSMYMTDEFLSK